MDARVTVAHVHTELPSLRVVPPHGPERVPIDENTSSYEDCSISVQSFSTFPFSGNFGARHFDPNTCSFFASLRSNFRIVVFSKGMNLGKLAKLAGAIAVTTVGKYLDSKRNEMKDVQDVGHFLLLAFQKAHQKIFTHDKEDYWAIGTALVTAVVCVQLEHSTSTDAKWAVVCINVGSNKAFLISRGSGIVDITKDNLEGVSDHRDVGGRLGPYLDGGAPDLRNLKLYFIPCEYNDMVLVTPFKVHLCWEDFYWNPDGPEKIQFSKYFNNCKLRQIISSSPGLSPSTIINKVINDIMEYTHALQVMEMRVRHNYLPGTIGHCACIAFFVSNDGVPTLIQHPSESLSAAIPELFQQMVRLTADCPQLSAWDLKNLAHVSHEFRKMLIPSLQMRLTVWSSTPVAPTFSPLKFLLTSTPCIIPPQITHLTFSFNFNQVLPILPSSITHLSFGYEFNHPVSAANLPASLKYLSFGYEFNQPVNDLPNTITHLSFGYIFNQDPNHLPPSLLYLEFGCNFSQAIRSLPPFLHDLTIKSLSCILYCSMPYLVRLAAPPSCFTNCFPQVTHLTVYNNIHLIDWDTLFPSLTHMKLTPNVYLRFDLPSSLTHLTLSLNFNHSLSFPESLLFLSLGEYYTKSLTLPPSLTYLKIGYYLPKFENEFPSSLLRVVVQHQDLIPLIQPLLPPTTTLVLAY